ncbi:hypothetical protein DENSPDRAFT_843179 [Dentipellis sp. KUC8613]|nr:hypothetical protein DENSPDRAFT_843179 [Dentipellis sp. KUC8613]
MSLEARSLKNESSHNSLSTLEKSVSRIPVAVEEQSFVLADIHRALESSRASSQLPVILTDSLSQYIRLLFEPCDSWDIFDGILKLYFKNRAGSQYV